MGLFLCLVLLSLFQYSICDTLCLNKNCYWVEKEPQKFDDAVEKCYLYGGTLPSYLSEEERGFLSGKLNKDKSYWAGLLKIRDTPGLYSIETSKLVGNVKIRSLGLINDVNCLAVKVKNGALEILEDSCDKPQHFICKIGLIVDDAERCPDRWTFLKGLKKCYKLDKSQSEADEYLVYKHVKQGGNRYARLLYGIKFDENRDEKVNRPFQIYYHFKMYENFDLVSSVIERLFENSFPSTVFPLIVHHGALFFDTP